MDRDKKQQIILIVLIPVFLLSLLYTRMQKKASEDNKEGIKQEDSLCQDKRINEIAPPRGDLDIEYALLKKDPLKNLLQLYLYKTRVVQTEEKVTIPLPELTIEGIIWNSHMPQAIVNGKIVRIGDIVKDVEIIDIKRNGIVVGSNGEKFLIER